MSAFFEQASPGTLAVIFGAIGLAIGFAIGRWIRRLAPLAETRGARLWHDVSVALGLGLLFAAFAVAYLRLDCQVVTEVRPDAFWRHARLAYHLVLLALLAAATGTDLRDYTVPDAITLTGTGIGLAGAAIAGQLQMIHLWVDWNGPFVELVGPEIPAWLDRHRHLHGLAWSGTGVAAGAGLTWFVRWLSSTILGRETMGFGDVTLMAMIGSFVGWQPAVIIFLLAPLCAVFVGLAVRLTSPRTYVPYGPYLAAATLVVLFGWRWIWSLEIPWTATSAFSLRRLFGDGIGLLIVGGIALGALAGLLLLLRLYRAIPVSRRPSSS